MRWPECSIEQCGNPSQSKEGGWCNKHYARWKRHGDPYRGRLTTDERFWAKVQKSEDPDGCWLWQGALAVGYGMFRLNTQKNVRAHRWVYERLVGPIPEDRPHLDHLCRTPACVNPRHLEPVTPGENTRRGDSPQGVAYRLNQCKKGHSEWYTFPDGRRRCRVCQREAQRRHDAKRRAKPPA